MIKLAQDRGVITLINAFSSEPRNQQHLIDALIRATKERLGSLPGIISAALHRSKDGSRVVNDAQRKSVENWENLFRNGSESWFREMAKYAKPDTPISTRFVTARQVRSAEPV